MSSSTIFATVASTNFQDSKNVMVQTPESLCSDNPSSSCASAPVIPKFSLTQSFPSILSTAKIIRSLRGSANADTIQTLSQVFSTCLRTILRSMDGLPHDVRLNPTYEVAQYGVILTGNLFSAEISKQVDTKETKPIDISMILELMDMTIAHLRSFLKVVQHILAENKPLPALPTDSFLITSTDQEVVPLALIVEQVLNAEETHEPRCGLLQSFPGDRRFLSNTREKICMGKMIRRILGRGSISSKASLFTNQTSPSATLVDQDRSSLSVSLKESFMTEVKPRAPELAYFPRQSAIYYLADPYCPEIDVDMPLPTGDVVAVRLDQHGVIKAASLTALVRILTSKDSVLDQEFAPTFFVCFRFFTTPTKFLQELIKRFDELPPPGLNTAQLRIWTRNAMGVHIRVGKTILMWLDLYWKSEFDSEILEALQLFTLERLVGELPEGLVKHILEGLDLVWGNEPICRRTRKANDLEFIYNQTMSPTLMTSSTSKTSIDPSIDSITQLLCFDTPCGREEFARQLTVRLSEQFQLVDPEDAIKHWHSNEGSTVGRILQEIMTFERALCSWVTHTILSQITPTERCRMLELWLDISTRCLRLRNFSGAHCIVGGLSNGAIGRMKQTILRVSVSSKQQFRMLQSFFRGQDNFTDYRESLTSIEPTVPMIGQYGSHYAAMSSKHVVDIVTYIAAPLIRDITSALAVIPTAIGSTEGGNDDTLINLRPYRVVAKTVRAMETCLIPYKISKSDEFYVWIGSVLAGFPVHLESQTNDNFYTSSIQLEAKEPSLSHLTEPWLYTITGTVTENYILHHLPPLSLTRAKTNHVPAFLRRF